MTLRRRIRYALEYVGVRLGQALVRALPLRAALALASVGGDIAYAFMAKRRAIAIDNILQAGIATTRREASRIARGSFRHFGALTVEAIVSEKRIRPDNWREHVDTSGAEYIIDLARQPGVGIILTTAHFGNWEIAGQMFSFLKPLEAVARRMNNPYTDAVIQDRNRNRDIRMIMKHEVTGKRLLKVLRDGHILAMLIDQHARRRGMMIPFFGRPAATHTAAAVLHLRSGAPLCFGCLTRLGPLRYRLDATPIVERRPGAPRDEAAIAAILRSVTKALEDVIRAHPEQYLWGHRRWRPKMSHRLRAPPPAPAPTPVPAQSGTD